MSALTQAPKAQAPANKTENPPKGESKPVTQQSQQKEAGTRRVVGGEVQPATLLTAGMEALGNVVKPVKKTLGE